MSGGSFIVIYDHVVVAGDCRKVLDGEEKSGNSLGIDRGSLESLI